jgi:hypothetical protein
MMFFFSVSGGFLVDSSFVTKVMNVLVGRPSFYRSAVTFRPFGFALLDYSFPDSGRLLPDVSCHANPAFSNIGIASQQSEPETTYPKS